MRAAVVEQFGGPDVLQVRERPAPTPGPGEIAIDVAYAGLNYVEVMMRSRGYGGTELPVVPGLEAAGSVRALGEGANGVAVGQSVAAFTGSGAYADVAIAPVAFTFGLPDGVDLRTAAALPTIVPTAHVLVHEAGRMREGETVLVHAAAGGVGTVVGQMARLAKAGRVIGVVSRPEKADHALQYGYDEVVLAADLEERVRALTDGRGVDLVLDPNGGETWRRSLDVLAPFGRIVGFGDAADDPWSADFATLGAKGAGALAFSIGMMSRHHPDALRAVADRSFRLVAEGKVEVPITAEFDLADAAEAHRLMESRASTGKIVLRVGGPA